jgi:hypothetical protein
MEIVLAAPPPQTRHENIFGCLFAGKPMGRRAANWLQAYGRDAWRTGSKPMAANGSSLSAAAGGIPLSQIRHRSAQTGSKPMGATRGERQ